MFRINLFRENQLKKRAARRQLLSRSLLWILICLEGIMLAFMAVSATLLMEQGRSLRAAIPALEQQVQAASASRPELDLARDLVTLRTGRTDWAPMLAALSEKIDPSLRLISLKGQAGAPKKPAQFECEGVIRKQDGQLEDVTRFINALQNDPRLSRTFPTIRLGTIRAGGTDNFLVIGEGTAGGSP